jgi:hypothetical protein
MKKLFIIALAGLVCLAFTSPAMAKLEFSGLFQLDVYYNDISGEAARGGVAQGAVNRHNGTDVVDIDLANTGNRLYWKYTSDDKKLISYWQLRPLREDDGTAENILELGWVQWELSPMFKLRFGKSEQAFAIMSPSITVARDGAAPIVGIGYCNIHGGTAREQVKAYIYPAENIRIEIAAIQPDTDNGEIALFPNAENGGAGGEAVAEENTIPRFDLAVNFKVANFTIEPSVTYLNQEYDQVRAGDDDEVEIWGAALGVSAGFGPLSIKAEVAFGENLGNGNYVGGSVTGSGFGGAVGYADNTGAQRVEDTENLGYWIDLGFKFGPASLHLIYGALEVENDGDPSVSGANEAAAGREFDVKNQVWAVNLPISVAKGWTIKPEIAYMDNDDDAVVNGVNTDYGDRFSVGVGFILKF